ncbi:MAG: adenine-specific methyltransferase EcoRI family protein [Oscillospiraceae bacterium]|nr:adenine-specific methyltransferase EcoRI family protein [Oscillospiraceae bacterium]
MAEMRYYQEQFRGKVIFCNCDDPYESNFFKYFAMNFNFLGLKKLIATCYIGSPIANVQLSLFDDEPIEDKTTRAPHRIEITEVEDYNKDGAVDLTDVEYLLRNKKNALTRLQGDGDFRSSECIELLKQADIVVTNPPFSLFREYVTLLMEYAKDFLILGDQNAITTKELFRFVQDNRLWLGYCNGGTKWFRVPDDYEIETESRIKIENGIKYFSMGRIFWYTTLDTTKRHEKQILYKSYSPASYPHYDNYDAIEVPAVSEIPMDWDGAMGVPITFLDKYNPEQFEILAITKTWYGAANKKYPEQIQIDKNGKRSKVTKLNDGAVIKLKSPPAGKTYYMVDGECYIQTYPRIIIRRIGDFE